MLSRVLRGLVKKQTIFRSLFELSLESLTPSSGAVVDLGGVKMPFPGYAKALKADAERITTVNISTTVGADIVGDAAATGLASALADDIWMFNLLEHVEYPERVLAEAKRLAKPGARCIGVVPFLLGIHGEPDDYLRYTKSKLMGLLRDAGFTDVKITAIGHGPFVAGASQVQALLPWFVSGLPVVFAWCTDMTLFKLRPQWREKWPLGYVFEARAM
ncbi:MAG: methyltransferase domain-containing protein [Patescibacteria group bacterium]